MNAIDNLRTLRIDLAELRCEEREVQALFAQIVSYATLAYPSVPPALRLWALKEDKIIEDETGFLSYLPLAELIVQLSNALAYDKKMFITPHHRGRALWYMLKYAKLPAGAVYGDGGFWPLGEGVGIGVQRAGDIFAPKFRVSVGRKGVLISKVCIIADEVYQIPYAAWLNEKKILSV